MPTETSRVDGERIELSSLVCRTRIIPLYEPPASLEGIEPSSGVLEAPLRPSLKLLALRTGLEPVSVGRQPTRDPVASRSILDA